MEPSASNALVRLTATFEGHPLTVIEIAGQPHWLARQVGEALGHVDGGSGFVKMIGRDWSDELFTGVDYRLLAGDELATVKTLLGPEVIDPRTPSLLLLTQQGVFAASMLSRQPKAKELRRWLSSEVLPEIAATGSYKTPSAAITDDAPLEKQLADLRNLHTRGLLHDEVYTKLQLQIVQQGGIGPVQLPTLQQGDVALPTPPPPKPSIEDDGWMKVSERLIVVLVDAWIQRRQGPVPREIASLNLLVHIRDVALNRPTKGRPGRLPSFRELAATWGWTLEQVRHLEQEQTASWCPAELMEAARLARSGVGAGEVTSLGRTR